MVKLRIFFSNQNKVPITFVQYAIEACNYEKCNIPTVELHHLVKLLDEKLHICETCHKYLYKNGIPCQAGRNKMDLDPVPDQIN